MLKKAFPLPFFCLVLFTGCEVLNQPIISVVEERLAELRLVHTIFVKTPPKKNIFADGESIPENAETWASEYGLEIHGMNSLNELLDLAPGKDYTVDALIDGESPGIKTVTVKLNANDSKKTEFWITVLKADEKYYTIEPYISEEGKVYAEPSMIAESQFDGEEVSVKVIILPYDSYAFKDGTLIFSGREGEKEPVPAENGKYSFKKTDFKDTDEMFRKNIELHAVFGLAKGVVKMDDVYYGSLEEALAAAPDDTDTESDITVVTGFSIGGSVEIPEGKFIRLGTDNDAIKKITGDISVSGGLTLDGNLTVNGTVTVKTDARLVVKGPVSVNEVVLEGDAVIEVGGGLTPPEDISVKKISTTKTDGAVLRGVVATYQLTEEDCDKFILADGKYALKLSENEGVLALVVAARWVSGNQKYYASLQEAVDASTESNPVPDQITVLKSHSIGNEINIDSRHVLLVPVYGVSEITLTRDASFTTGSLFTVESGASLTLAGNGSVTLVIDGGKGKSITADSALITVDGTLTMNSGVTLQNNKNTSGTGGGVYVSGGAFTMSGGAISGNEATGDGGGVYVAKTFTMTGGTIGGDTAGSENTAIRGGGVFVVGQGTFTMSGSAKISGNSALSGGGVNVDEGEFTMQGGTINKNKATHSGQDARGGGVYMEDGTFNMNSGAISGNTATGGNSEGGGVYVTDGCEFTMSGGTIGGITADSGNTAQSGGGVFVQSGTFAMEGSATISGNTATSSGGGGVYVYGSGTEFKMEGSATISGNTANTSGGGVYMDAGTFTMSSGTISGNEASNKNGGGVYAYGGTFNMNGGAISGNKANGSGDYGGGGGVYMEGGTFTMSSGTISGNKATGSGGYDGGGGVYANGGTFTMSGSATISGNEATIKNGGGVHAYGGTFNMEGGTISGNKAISDGGLGGGVFSAGSNSTFTMTGGTIGGTTAGSGNKAQFGGGVYQGSGTFKMEGGTISGNIDSVSGGGVFVQGTFKMEGGTISGNTATSNGGGVRVDNTAAFTMSGSAVVKQNNDVSLLSGKVITVDGLDGGSGLVAKITPDVTTEGTTVLKAATGATLSDAIIERFTTSVGKMIVLEGNEGKLKEAGAAVDLTDDTTIYKATLQEAIPLATGGTAANPIEVRLLADVTISSTVELSGKHIRLVSDGGERTITRGASGFGSLFTVESGSLTLGGGNYGLVIDGGKGEGLTATAALVMVNSGTLTMNAGVTLQNNKNIYNATNADSVGGGGGVYVGGGNFTMKGGIISGNDGNSFGGGVCVASGSGAFTMNGGTISGNNATHGGGVNFHGGNFTMTGGTISGNKATYNGGGVRIAVLGGFDMKGGKISGNECGAGGGVYVSGSVTFTMFGTAAISGNETSNSNNSAHGGGVHMDGGTFNMKGGTISGNTAGGSDGGGVYVKSELITFTMSGGTIGGNTANRGGGVYNAGAFAMSGGTISGNSTDGDKEEGGGVFTATNSTFTMSGTTAISKNTATTGGGVFVGTGTFNMSNGTISGNKASGNGGGVYINGQEGAFNKTGGTVYGINDTNNANTATNDSAALYKQDGTVTIGGTVFAGTAKNEDF